MAKNRMRGHSRRTGRYLKKLDARRAHAAYLNDAARRRQRAAEDTD